MTKNLNFIKYLSVYILPILCLVALFMDGWWTYSALFYAFGLIPLLEIILPASEKNFSKAEEVMAKKDKIYDYLLYSIVPIQYILLVSFLFVISKEASTFEVVGRILSFGICCGVLGINVAHELGHRKSWFEKFLAKCLLLTSLYMHFIIEHNFGHHKNIATEEDPASSKKWELVYTFWIKSIVLGYISAWKITASQLKKKDIPFWSAKNEMIQFTFIQIALLTGIYFAFGGFVLACFTIAAIIGFLLLETVNYIEHYGLRRQKVAGKNFYEKVGIAHSWNSNHAIGRIVMFELSRHSDHHFNATRKYQILRSFEKAPQMPTGYPGMMILSLIPPLFFYVLHPKLEQLNAL